MTQLKKIFRENKLEYFDFMEYSENQQKLLHSVKITEIYSRVHILQKFRENNTFSKELI